MSGHYRPGQTFEAAEGWAHFEGFGKKFVYSDAGIHSLPFLPSFPILPIEAKDEVEFLLRVRELQTPDEVAQQRFSSMRPFSRQTLDRYQVRDVDEAIRRVQGMSNESKEVGMRYLNNRKPFPARQMIDAIDAVKSELVAGTNVWLSQDHVGNLVEALMLADDPEVTNYILSQVEWCLTQKDGSLDMSHIPRAITPRGLWLTDLLGLAGDEWKHRSYAMTDYQRRSHSQLVKQERQIVLKALPKLSGLVLAEAVYALYETKASTIEDLQQVCEKSNKKNEFALGIFWSAERNTSSLFGRDGKGLTDLKLLKKWVTWPELKTRISKEITDATELDNGWVRNFTVQ